MSQFFIMFFGELNAELLVNTKAFSLWELNVADSADRVPDTQTIQNWRSYDQCPCFECRVLSSTSRTYCIIDQGLVSTPFPDDDDMIKPWLADLVPLPGSPRTGSK